MTTWYVKWPRRAVSCWSVVMTPDGFGDYFRPLRIGCSMTSRSTYSSNRYPTIHLLTVENDNGGASWKKWELESFARRRPQIPVSSSSDVMMIGMTLRSCVTSVNPSTHPPALSILASITGQSLPHCEQASRTIFLPLRPGTPAPPGTSPEAPPGSGRDRARGRDGDSRGWRWLPPRASLAPEPGPA